MSRRMIVLGMAITLPLLAGSRSQSTSHAERSLRVFPPWRTEVSPGETFDDVLARLNENVPGFDSLKHRAKVVGGLMSSYGCRGCREGHDDTQCLCVPGEFEYHCRRWDEWGECIDYYSCLHWAECQEVWCCIGVTCSPQAGDSWLPDYTRGVYVCSTRCPYTDHWVSCELGPTDFPEELIYYESCVGYPCENYVAGYWCASETFRFDPCTPRGQDCSFTPTCH